MDINYHDINESLPLLFFFGLYCNIPLLAGWFLDRIFGDPAVLPHPVVWFGRMISFGEKRLNQGCHRRMKGALLALFLIISIFVLSYLLLVFVRNLSVAFAMALESLLIFYCLAGTTLVREVRSVFLALDVSLEYGRSRVARIVGRDTSVLTENEVRTAALETLAENLSDGVIAPLFWLLVLGVPGMLTYKMINTLDSMIGYRTGRYREFGTFAARGDDVANYIPARLTALFMLIVSWRLDLFPFVMRNGRRHASPNSGYPEAALAGVLDCRFGGGHSYFGEYVEKPFIGTNDRQLNTADMLRAVRINRRSELLMLFFVILCNFLPAVFS